MYYLGLTKGKNKKGLRRPCLWIHDKNSTEIIKIAEFRDNESAEEFIKFMRENKFSLPDGEFYFRKSIY